MGEECKLPKGSAENFTDAIIQKVNPKNSHRKFNCCHHRMFNIIVLAQIFALHSYIMHNVMTQAPVDH